MNRNEAIQKLNTIYIISKGRPQCITAKTLSKMNYPGERFIVCGNNDDTISEYKRLWGENRVLVFDWYEVSQRANLLDNFGLEKMGSGCVPARMAVDEIARQRGELRYWEFDDDYANFYIIANSKKKWQRLNGTRFQQELLKLATFAHRCKLANMGFALGSDTRPETYAKVGRRVFNAHNLPTDPSLVQPWRGRMNEDLINAIDVHRSGRYELFVKYLMLTMAPTQAVSGGNTEIYNLSGTVRKTAYAIMVEPSATKLVAKHGRYHHRVNWPAIIPKVIHEKHAKRG